MSLEIANTIRYQLLTLGRTKVWSWGANAWTGGKNFLAFKVQGFKLKGVVKITLTSMDDYTIEFFKTRLGVTSTLETSKPYRTIEGVFFDEMVDIIDNEVEFTGADYEDRVKKAKYNF